MACPCGAFFLSQRYANETSHFKGGYPLTMRLPKLMLVAVNKSVQSDKKRTVHRVGV